MLLLTAKNVAIFFALATTAFCIATIVLAVEKSNLQDDLQDALDKLDTISTITTPSPTDTSPITPSPSTPTDLPDPSSSTETDPSNPTEPNPTTSTEPNPTNPSPSTVDPWPTVTAPSTDPNFPTLPTGLPNPEEVIYRLPTDIRPIKYKLYWHPDLVAKTCESTVSIQIEIDKETNLIVLHAKDMEIDSVSILNMMARIRIRVKAFYLAPEREMLFIELEELLYTATPYVVSISYHCRLDGLSGMYASSYLGENGEESKS